MLCPKCLENYVESDMKVTKTEKSPASVEEYVERGPNEPQFVIRTRKCPVCGYRKKFKED